MCRKDVHCKLLALDAIDQVCCYSTKDYGTNVQDYHISYIQVLFNVLIYVDSWSLDDHKDYRYDSEHKIVEKEYLTDKADTHLNRSSSVNKQESNDIAYQEELILKSAAVDNAVHDLNRLYRLFEDDSFEIFELVYNDSCEHLWRGVSLANRDVAVL